MATSVIRLPEAARHIAMRGVLGARVLGAHAAAKMDGFRSKVYANRSVDLLVPETLIAFHQVSLILIKK